MEEIISLLLEHGGTVVMAVLFVYIFLTDRKDNMRVLKELSNSNQNIAKSLNLLQISTDNNTAEYRRHDERAIEQFSHIKEHLIKIEEKIEK